VLAVIQRVFTVGYFEVGVIIKNADRERLRKGRMVHTSL
jgi:hypothetical protein